MEQLIVGVIALVLAGIDQVQAAGRSLTAWAVIVIAVYFVLNGLGVL
jgi:hypothetical protein